MFESIILIGPGTELYPLINNHLPITSLPILNKPLLEYNIELLLPISKTLYIVILEEKISTISNIVEKYNEKIRVVGVSCYDGSVSAIRNIGSMITSNNIIVTKGDLITDIRIENVAKKFLETQAYFLTILAETKNDNVTLGFQRDELLFYSTSPVFEFPDKLFSNGKITLSREVDTIQFYMFRKEVLRMFNNETFGFKNNLLPKLVDELREVRPVVLYSEPNAVIHQIKNKENYLKVNRLLKLRLNNEHNAIFDKAKQKQVKQYIKKNELKDFSNFLGSIEVCKETIVLNSIVGDGTKIGYQSKIFSSIIMEAVQVGEGCIIDRCIIGCRVNILPGSTLIDCVISPGYCFKDQIQSNNGVFGNNDK
ncbi:putative translation initiation factor eIF-2B subunit gamma [Nosema granulosis]|uniref:Translation initiation factor eIF2B subunit gamma n=1 Tax=Nosema granulosis TaxID=83296 RepID=A0A9P6H0P1_9MICR|nr:putative translation initiation factor eIF-2B subunit gamma [Nosema granulosis]